MGLLSLGTTSRVHSSISALFTVLMFAAAIAHCEGRALGSLCTIIFLTRVISGNCLGAPWPGGQPGRAGQVLAEWLPAWRELSISLLLTSRLLGRLLLSPGEAPGKRWRLADRPAAGGSAMSNGQQGDVPGNHAVGDLSGRYGQRWIGAS